MTSISVQLFTNSDKLFQGHRVTFKPRQQSIMGVKAQLTSIDH